MPGSEGLKLGEKLSFFTPDSTYHGGRGEGFGRRSFTCGQYFEGRWKNEEQEGPGKLTTDAGSAYDGEWSNGMMHGQGKVRAAPREGSSQPPRSNPCVGPLAPPPNTMNEGPMHGSERDANPLCASRLGVRACVRACVCRPVSARACRRRLAAHSPPLCRTQYTWASGSTYDGQWKENMKHGKGKLTLKNAWYDGEWKKNTKHGWGVYQVTETTPFGILRYEGEWDHDARTGKGIATGVDGHVELCRYDNGLRVGEGVRLMNAEALSRWDNEETGVSGAQRLHAASL